MKREEGGEEGKWVKIDSLIQSGFVMFVFSVLLELQLGG